MGVCVGHTSGHSYGKLSGGVGFLVSQHGKFGCKGQNCRACLAKYSSKKEHVQSFLGWTRVSASENGISPTTAMSVILVALPQPSRHKALAC